MYGYFAGVFAPVFPAETPTAGLIAPYGIFAAGLMMRPLGDAIFGWFGDRYGRARTMQLSVMLMTLPTPLPGLLPAYSQIGLIAPTPQILGRRLQKVPVGIGAVGALTRARSRVPLRGTDARARKRVAAPRQAAPRKPPDWRAQSPA